MPLPGLPKDFTFGVATSSFQIEGATHVDERGPSIWDTFCDSPGRIVDASTGEVACDHYHRYPEDIALMQSLGVDAYRFSVAWPRIQADGTGPGNPKGLAFYDRLVDGLLEAGIRPLVTLYHWDLPQALQDNGGWVNRDIVARFTEYAMILHNHLGDRVQDWITHNEPWCASLLSYSIGVHAPGLQLRQESLQAAHHLLLSHGEAVKAMRANAADHRLGITLNLTPVTAASDSPADQAAAARAVMWHNTLFTDPVLAGRYPELAKQVWGDIVNFDFLRDGDLATIAAPCDFFGINYYTPTYVQAGAATTSPSRQLFDLGYQAADPDLPRSDMGWLIEPDGLRRLLVWLKDTYPQIPPILITENGCASPDSVADDGAVHDPMRVDYVRSHVAAIGQACTEGVDVRGYYCWSLLDNFEWAEGYLKRFGLVHVDYETQTRTPKDGYHAYRELIAHHRA